MQRRELVTQIGLGLDRLADYNGMEFIIHLSSISITNSPPITSINQHNIIIPKPHRLYSIRTQPIRSPVSYPTPPPNIPISHQKPYQHPNPSQPHPHATHPPTSNPKTSQPLLQRPNPSNPCWPNPTPPLSHPSNPFSSSSRW